MSYIFFHCKQEIGVNIFQCSPGFIAPGVFLYKRHKYMSMYKAYNSHNRTPGIQCTDSRGGTAKHIHCRLRMVFVHIVMAVFCIMYRFHTQQQALWNNVRHKKRMHRSRQTKATDQQQALWSNVLHKKRMHRRRQNKANR